MSERKGSWDDACERSEMIVHMSLAMWTRASRTAMRKGPYLLYREQSRKEKEERRKEKEKHKSGGGVVREKLRSEGSFDNECVRGRKEKTSVMRGEGDVRSCRVWRSAQFARATRTTITILDWQPSLYAPEGVLTNARSLALALEGFEKAERAEGSEGSEVSGPKGTRGSDLLNLKSLCSHKI